MNELSITLHYEDHSYYSDAIICSAKETKAYIAKLKKIMSNEDETSFFFNSGDDLHLFSRGVIENSIITLTIRAVEDNLELSQTKDIY